MEPSNIFWAFWAWQEAPAGTKRLSRGTAEAQSSCAFAACTRHVQARLGADGLVLDRHGAAQVLRGHDAAGRLHLRRQLHALLHVQRVRALPQHAQDDSQSVQSAARRQKP
jgi:hypothetical protein